MYVCPIDVGEYTLIEEKKIHSSCEIIYFFGNLYLQAACDAPIARITGCVSSLRILVGDSPCNESIAIRVNRVMLVSLFARKL